MKKLLAILLLILSNNLFSQEPVRWNFRVVTIQPGIHEVHFTATISPPYHIYSQYQEGEYSCEPTNFTFKLSPEIKIFGSTIERGKPELKVDTAAGLADYRFRDSVDFIQRIVVKTRKSYILEGSVEFQVCSDEICLPIKYVKFKIPLP